MKSTLESLKNVILRFCPGVAEKRSWMARNQEALPAFGLLLFLFSQLPCSALLIDEAALLKDLPPAVAQEAEASAVEGAEAVAEDMALAATGETVAAIEEGAEISDKDLSGMSLGDLQKTAQEETLASSGEEPIEDIAIEEGELGMESEAGDLINMSMDDLRNEAMTEAGLDPSISTGLGSGAELMTLGLGGAGIVSGTALIREVVGKILDPHQLKMMAQRANMMAGQAILSGAIGGGMGGLMMGPSMGTGMGMSPHMGMSGMGMMGGVTGISTSRYGFGSGGGGLFGRSRLSDVGGFQRMKY